MCVLAKLLMPNGSVYIPICKLSPYWATATRMHTAVKLVVFSAGLINKS